MPWVLIVITLSSAAPDARPIATVTTEFRDRAACERAKDRISVAVAASPFPVAFTLECRPQGTTA